MSKQSNLEPAGQSIWSDVPVRTFLVIVACLSVFGITIGLGMPLVAIVLEKRGYSGSVIGAISAVPAFGTLIVAYYVPKLMSIFGTRKVIYASVIIESVSFLLLAWFDDLVAWFVIRFVMGGSGAGLFIASETWVNQLANQHNRGRLMAVYGTVLGVTMALGPVILTITGSDSWTPFVAGAVLVALAGLVLLLDRGTIAPAVDGDASFNPVTFLLVAPTVCLAILATSWHDVSVFSLLPVYALKSGLGEANAALMVSGFLFGMVLLTFPIGWAADIFPRYVVLISCGVGTAVGAALLPAVIGTFLPAVLTLFLWGGFANGLYAVAMTIVGDRFTGAELATAQASFGVIWGIGSLIGPATTGVAMDAMGNDGLPVMLVLVAVAFLVIATIRVFMRRT